MWIPEEDFVYLRILKHKMMVIHKIKRFIQRVGIKIIKLTDPRRMEVDKMEYESESIAICRKLLNKPDTILLISPISGKRYIKSDENQLFIIIERQRLTIVNHQYSYNIDLSNKALDWVIGVFDNEVEKRRELMENEIRSNVKHSLSSIYNNLIHE